MFGSKKIDWAKEPLISDTIADLRSDLMGVLANLIILEKKALNPNYKTIVAYLDEMDKIDDLASIELNFKSQKEAEKYIVELRVRLEQLLEDRDGNLNSAQTPYAFIR